MGEGNPVWLANVLRRDTAYRVPTDSLLMKHSKSLGLTCTSTLSILIANGCANLTGNFQQTHISIESK